MKLINNFAELLHSEKLPEDFRDWFIFEENDFEKECKFFYSFFTPHFAKDAVRELKTKFKFYRKKISNKDFEVQQKLLREIPVFPYLENLVSIWETRHLYLSSKRNWEVLINFPHEDGTEQFMKNLDAVFQNRFWGVRNETEEY